jgi:predicted nucleic acid-binding protein
MLLDSNILIYALNSSSPKCAAAQTFIRQNCSQAVVAQQNIFEAIRVLTHPKFSAPFKPKQAVKAVTAISSQLQIIQPAFETTQLTVELIKKYRVTGSQIFDAYLVATALNSGVEQIVTDNTKHLKIYREIEVSNPF